MSPTEEIAASGQGQAIEDGTWRIELGPEVTGNLAAGLHRLVVIVVSKRIVISTTASFMFTVVP